MKRSFIFLVIVILMTACTAAPQPQSPDNSEPVAMVQETTPVPSPTPIVFPTPYFTVEEIISSAESQGFRAVIINVDSWCGNMVGTVCVIAYNKVKIVSDSEFTVWVNNAKQEVASGNGRWSFETTIDQFGGVSIHSVCGPKDIPIIVSETVHWDNNEICPPPGQVSP